MALLFMDGFDAGDYLLKYNVGSGTGFSSTAPGRLGPGRCLQKNHNSNGTLYKAFTPSASIIVGFACYYTTNSSGAPAIMMAVFGDSGATAHIQVATGDVAGTIEVSRGYSWSRTVLFTASVPINTWNYYELRVKVSDTVGYADLKVNGATVGTFSGDTKNGGTSTNIDNIVMAGSANNTSIVLVWDDLYVIDETGSSPYNTYLGDVRVHSLVPSGAGSSTQLSPSTGANYTTVDELPYSATDYVYGTAGQTDLYTASDLPGGTGVIYGVQTNAVVKKTDAGNISARSAVKTGGTTYYGTSTAVGTSDQVVSRVDQTNPATATAWTSGDVNGMEIGIGAV